MLDCGIVVDVLDRGIVVDVLDRGISEDVLDRGISEDVLDRGISEDVLDCGIVVDVLDRGTAADVLDCGIAADINVLTILYENIFAMRYFQFILSDKNVCVCPLFGSFSHSLGAVFFVKPFRRYVLVNTKFPTINVRKNIAVFGRKFRPDKHLRRIYIIVRYSELFKHF